MEDNVLHLEVWAGDWDLPSVDSNCLAAWAYCKFSGVPVKVHSHGNPWKSPSGTFPLMRHNGVSETKVASIFNYLRKQSWGSDFNLSVRQSADVLAYTAMLEDRLLPALMHLWWIESDTYINITRPMYTMATPVPFKFWLPSSYYKKVENRLYTGLGTENITPADLEAKIYRDAKDCLTYLSNKLADQDYFFGTMPSSLDALVFGYVAPLLKAPLNSNQVTNHLRSFCENLCLHTNRILREFFPFSEQDPELRRKNEERKKAAEAKAEFPNKRRNMILAGVFALTVMTTYAFMSGLISVEVVDDDDPVS